LAPLWFGTWNVISILIAKYFKLSLQMRFLLISLISYMCIILIASWKNVYDFSKKQWLKYYILQFFMYMFIWNLVIYQIENLIS